VRRSGIHSPHGDSLSSLSIGGPCCVEGKISIGDLSSPVPFAYVAVPRNAVSATYIELVLEMVDAGNTRIVVFGSIGLSSTRGEGDVVIDQTDSYGYPIDAQYFRGDIDGERFDLVPAGAGDHVTFAVSYVRPNYTPTSATLSYLVRELTGCVVTGV
jgi:hypothetical protein